MKLDLLGISEMRWPDKGDFGSGDLRKIHTGTIGERPGEGGVGLTLQQELERSVKGYVQYNGRIGEGGVGLTLKQELGRSVKGYVQYNSRIFLVKLKSKPKYTVIV